MPLRSVLVAMVIAPKNLLLELHPVQRWPLDGMEALWVALSCATAWKSCVLLRCCAWPCVGRALMPGGYGFDATGLNSRPVCATGRIQIVVGPLKQRR